MNILRARLLRLARAPHRFRNLVRSSPLRAGVRNRIARQDHRLLDRPRVGKLPWRQSAAIGFGLNAQGRWRIILALLGPRRRPHQVAALRGAGGDGSLTSLLSGPVMKRLLYSSEPEEEVVALLQGRRLRRAAQVSDAIGGAIHKARACARSRSWPASSATPVRRCWIASRIAPTGLGARWQFPMRRSRPLPSRSSRSASHRRGSISTRPTKAAPLASSSSCSFRRRPTKQEVRILASIAQRRLRNETGAGSRS